MFNYCCMPMQRTRLVASGINLYANMAAYEKSQASNLRRHLDISRIALLCASRIHDGLGNLFKCSHTAYRFYNVVSNDLLDCFNVQHTKYSLY